MCMSDGSVGPLRRLRFESFGKRRLNTNPDVASAPETPTINRDVWWETIWPEKTGEKGWQFSSDGIQWLKSTSIFTCKIRQNQLSHTNIDANPRYTNTAFTTLRTAKPRTHLPPSRALECRCPGSAVLLWHVVAGCCRIKEWNRRISEGDAKHSTAQYKLQHAQFNITKTNERFLMLKPYFQHYFDLQEVSIVVIYDIFVWATYEITCLGKCHHQMWGVPYRLSGFWMFGT